MEYCLGFAFDREGKSVLLTSKLKPEWQKGKLNGIGGKVEKGEPAKDAMIRESFEETGFGGWNWKFYAILYHPEWMLSVFKTFDGRVRLFEEGVKNDVGEKIKLYSLFDIGALHNVLLPNIVWLIYMALDESVDICIVKEGENDCA